MNGPTRAPGLSVHLPVRPRRVRGLVAGRAERAGRMGDARSHRHRAADGLARGRRPRQRRRGVVPPPRADEGASIVARRFTSSGGWPPLETADPPGPNVLQDTVAAMDTQGSVMVVWPERAGLLASRYAAGSGWSSPTRISREYPSPFSSIDAAPAVGFFSNGRALAA